MPQLDTTRSEKMARDFLARGQPFKRKVQVYTKHHNVPVENVFEQLCPTREADWIEGWVADLIYTETGYSEPDCILSTPAENILGAALWIITQRRRNELHEFVAIRDDGVVGHYTIELSDNGDGTCESRWTLVFTAVNKQGNDVVEGMPDEDPAFKTVVLGSLEHFLTTGERLTIAR